MPRGRSEDYQPRNRPDQRDVVRSPALAGQSAFALNSPPPNPEHAPRRCPPCRTRRTNWRCRICPQAPCKRSRRFRSCSHHVSSHCSSAPHRRDSPCARPTSRREDTPGSWVRAPRTPTTPRWAGARCGPFACSTMRQTPDHHSTTPARRDAAASAGCRDSAN